MKVQTPRGHEAQVANVATNGPRFRLVILIVGLALSWLHVAQYIAHVTSAGGERFQTGDWLINYSGGFVRRGLAGQSLLDLGLQGDRLLWAVAAMQLTLLATLYVLSVVLFRRTTRSNAWLMLALSPAFLLFPPLSLDGGQRKELIGLTALAILSVVASTPEPGCAWRRSRASLLVAGSAAFPIAALSHEVSLCLVPAAVFVVWIGFGRGIYGHWVAITSWILVATSGIVALLAIAFPGTSRQGQQICDALMERGLSDDICSGAIDYFGTPMDEALRFMMQLYPQYFSYLSLAVLALVPIYLVRASQRVWIVGAATYLLLLPELALGVDYGRWIFIATAAISLVSLTGGGKTRAAARTVPAAWLVAYVTLWSVPVLGFDDGDSLVIAAYRAVASAFGT